MQLIYLHKAAHALMHCQSEPRFLLQATFTDANSLTLSGVTSTAQFYGSGQDPFCAPTIYLYAVAAAMSLAR